jgi:hypothetical protein
MIPINFNMSEFLSNVSKKERCALLVLLLLFYYPFQSSVLIKPDNNEKQKTSSNNVGNVGEGVVFQNSGNVTAEKIELINNKQRTLDPDSEDVLKKELLNKDARIKIVSLLGDSEAYNFASQIKDFLVNEGYSKIEGVAQAVFSQHKKGAEIIHSPDQDVIMIWSQ